MEILKAVIPAITSSSRFGPLHHVIPHELLPLAMKPALYSIVEEALNGGLTTIMCIAGKQKQAIQNLLSHDAFGKIARKATISCIHEHEARGIAHALWLARDFFGKEYLALLSPDDIITGTPSAIGTLMRIARQEKGTVIAVREIGDDEIPSSALITVKKQLTTNLFQVGAVSTTHTSLTAPSRYAIIGRAVISHKIFQVLSELSAPDAATEPSYYEALNKLSFHNERIFAYKLTDTYFDISTPRSWLSAFLAHAQSQSTFEPALTSFMHNYHPAFTPAQEAVSAEIAARRLHQ